MVPRARYAGIFAVAACALALQVGLTRLLSVTTWYHLAFFAIAAAMLGMTSGAVAVFLGGDRFRGDRQPAELARASLAAGAAIPVALVVLCVVPIPDDLPLMTPLSLLLVTLAAFAPFHFLGVATAVVLTRSDAGAVGRLYAADLLGAAAGCVGVLGGLHLLDTPSLIVACGALACGAGLAFGWTGTRRTALACAALGLALTAAAAANHHGRWLTPIVAKGHLVDPRWYLVERWGAHSRVAVERADEGAPHLWGPSALAPRAPVRQHHLTIDGAADTYLRPPGEHLKFDVTNLAYHLRPRGGACVIGVGGGRDVQSARVFGHRRVLGVELDATFVDLLRAPGPLRDLAAVADDPAVELVVAEARAYLSRTDERFAVVQMSMIDTWAAAGAGALSLSENGLYTLEAWRVLLRRLSDDGILTVSRWYDPRELGEAGRLIGLAAGALLQAGVADPSRHIVLAARGQVCTLLLSARPFPDDELALLDRVCAPHGYDLPVRPGRAPAHPDLGRLLAARDLASLRLTSDDGLRYDPPTDDSPYFFNMLAPTALLDGGDRHNLGVVAGNIAATRVLLTLVGCLLLVAVLTVLVPLARRGGRPRLAGACYFALIGAGFMLVEIALIQKLSVLLSHPIYALGILLASVLLSAGLGSLLGERVRAPVWLLALATAAAILGASAGVDALQRATVAASLGQRVVSSVAAIAPLGLLLGLFFPAGMRLVADRPDETAWYWALNGVCGVLCSALAVLISVFAGIGATMAAGAGCYLLLAPVAWRLGRSG